MKKAIDLYQKIRMRMGKISPEEQEKTIQYLQKQELKKQIQDLLTEINVVQDHLDCETDFDLIEAHIWELNSLEARYKNALQKFKSAYQL